jgi:hypothetical protein
MILIFFCCFVNADGEQISGIGGPIVSVNENGESGNAAAQLSIELYQETGAGATVNPGDFARFTIKYKNISSSGLLFVEIRFFLPASPLFTYSSISGGTYNAADNSISWSKFFLSSGSSGTYVVEGKWGRLGRFFSLSGFQLCFKRKQQQFLYPVSQDHCIICYD